MWPRPRRHRPASPRRAKHRGRMPLFDRWFDEQSPSPSLPQAEPPSHVEIVGADYHYEYVVNGQPEIIKGMGLNTQYSQQLTPTQRAAQLDSDMQALQALGVNTVLGWDPAEFDGVLL